MSGPLILFDMDGVIFCEDGYLQCAALTIAQVYQMTHQEMTNWRYDPNRVAYQEDVIALQAVYLHEAVIRLLRQRAINNNWDKTFACLCILLAYPTTLPEEAIAKTLVSVFSQIEGKVVMSSPLSMLQEQAYETAHWHTSFLPNVGLDFIRYHQSGIIHEIWLEDLRALLLSYDLAVQNHLKGIAGWYLGIEQPSAWSSLVASLHATSA